MEKFCLKWVDYQSNISKLFQSLRDKEDFCDVTLVGDDFKQVKAHKVILSSCSEYFYNVLKANKKQPHPILCLEGLNFQDLQNVLDYIYNEELKIYQHDLDRFLAVAKRFRLEGLIGQENKETKETKVESSFEDSLNVRDISNVDLVKSNFHEQKEKTRIIFSAGDFETIEKLNEKVEKSYSRDNRGFFICHYCAKISNYRSHMKEHVEIHFEGLVLKCSFCDKTYKSRNYLRKHVKTHGN